VLLFLTLALLADKMLVTHIWEQDLLVAGLSLLGNLVAVAVMAMIADTLVISSTVAILLAWVASRLANRNKALVLAVTGTLGTVLVLALGPLSSITALLAFLLVAVEASGTLLVGVALGNSRSRRLAELKQTNCLTCLW
jgi:hypothetical protein